MSSHFNTTPWAEIFVSRISGFRKTMINQFYFRFQAGSVSQSLKELSFSLAKIQSQPKLFSSPSLMNFPEDQRRRGISDQIIRESTKFWFSFNAIEIKSNSLNLA